MGTDTIIKTFLYFHMEKQALQQINQFIKSAEKNQIIPAVSLLDMGQMLLDQESDIVIIHSFLELGHFSIINQIFADSPYLNEWLDLLVKLIKKSGYHIGFCLQQRVERYGDKPLFLLPHGRDVTPVTYSDAWSQIGRIGSSIHAISVNESRPVIGIFTPNSHHGAMVDLACLSFGFRIIPIPANVPLEYLKFIIEHGGVTHMFAGGSTQVNLVFQLQKIGQLPHTIFLPGVEETESEILSWETFLSVSPENLFDAPVPSDMDETVSIMYTSGTTANPKGIIFDHTNIMSKRFARALALPKISSDDTYLSYLPLFHTFGRFLELTGAIFWGATYTFAESPSFKSLVKDFSLVKPSIFISIPKRWQQIYDTVMESNNNATTSKEDLRKFLQKTTGKHLKWGLSAAGYLDPVVFTFFQDHGIQLLSGYGMTEATGGILMTPPGDYVQDSVGKPLPGIEAKLGEENELLIEGPYVSKGYYPKSPEGTFVDGWFRTGDVFREKKGHFYIIDRIKEIYKNSRGQTISPQKIENMFKDFDAVKSAFLVGDGLEYNTVLIYPATDQIPNEINRDDRDAIHEYFNTLVQSVNSFLPSYERVVSYIIIERDFSAEKGELTPKNTYKRKIILSHFSREIESMYRKEYSVLSHEQCEIRFPNWLLREKGMLRTDYVWDGKTISCEKTKESLHLEFDEKTIQIGDYIYEISYPVLDLDTFIRLPQLWLGNGPFTEFVGSSVFRIHKSDRSTNVILIEESIFNQQVQSITLSPAFKTDVRKDRFTLENFHISAKVLHQKRSVDNSTAMNHLSRAIQLETGQMQQIAKNVLLRMRYHPSPRLRLRAIEQLLSSLSGNEFINLFLETHDFAFNLDLTDELDIDARLLTNSHFQAILSYLKYMRFNIHEFDGKGLSMASVLLGCLVQYCTDHPASYIFARSEINWWKMLSPEENIRLHARKMEYQLTHDLRNWIGDNTHIAIDMDTGREYNWSDVLAFDSTVEEKHREVLTKVFVETSIVKETIFLITKRQLVQLNDIPQNGIWISLLGQRHGKSVFRVLVQTRSQKAFNFVINYNEHLDTSFFEDEIQWLLVMGSDEKGRKLVEKFGGYWSEYSLYTEEYIPGETLHQYLDRHRDEIGKKQAIDRWQMRWLHFIWNGCMAYIDFWYRTGYTLGIQSPSPKNLIIPEYDYTSGTRLISISGRDAQTDITSLLFGLYEQFILETESEFTGLEHMSDWEVIFTALIQVISVKSGLMLLNEFKQDIEKDKWKIRAKSHGLNSNRISRYISDIDDFGVLTKQVTFAALRFNRWMELNQEATKEARGTVLLDLYKDYHLRDLIDDYPETRIRFFLLTCFKNASSMLTNKLLRLQKDVRARRISLEDLDFQIQGLIETMDLSEEDEYFLTRLLFEHVQASDFGKLVTWDTGHQGHLDLISIVEDSMSNRYRIRPAFHPKEIAAFYGILSKANMKTSFHQKHQFLLLITSSDHIIGGIYWKDAGNKTAYLERIVISYEYRKKNLSTTLLSEFFQRLIHLNFQHVTVGYFQAGLFYKHGFSIDKQFGGLVKHLK